MRTSVHPLIQSRGDGQLLLRQVVANQIPFRYVVNDVWYASADNMLFVKHDLQRDFVMPLKTNRKVAFSAKARKQGQYVRVDEVVLEAGTTMTIYLEGVDFPLQLVKQVFTNGDGSVGILYLVTSDLELTYDGITTIYGKRWNVEPYHKSLKQNASLSLSPTKTVTTQSNHFFCCVVCLHQAGNAESDDENQPFCFEIQTLSAGITHRF
jgi:hypothetical protein